MIRKSELLTHIVINVIPTHELIQWFLANCQDVLVDTENIKSIISAIGKERFEKNRITLSSKSVFKN